MELLGLSRETFLLIYKISYYGGVVAICLGLTAIVLRTKCSFQELLALRYTPYYQSEVSAFILFLAVALVYLASAFGIPFLEQAISKVADFNARTGVLMSEQEKNVQLFGKYFMKTMLEFVLVYFTIVVHKNNEITRSKFTNAILTISFLYGCWHLVRALDVTYFQTNYLQSVYGPFNVLLTALVSLLMLIYAFIVTKKAYKEF